MRATVDLYLRQLQALMPRGLAWSRAPEATLTALLAVIAGGPTRAHNRALALIEETDPRTILELLAQWEAVCGLPDPCTGQARTLAERRDRVLAKWTARGGQSKVFFVGLAATLGYDITITEMRMRQHGRSRHGEPYGAREWHFVWRVNAALVNRRRRTLGSPHGEPYATWGNKALECVFERLKPAHTKIIFSYT